MSDGDFVELYCLVGVIYIISIIELVFNWVINVIEYF